MQDVWPFLVACGGLVSVIPVLARLRAGLSATALAPAWNWIAAFWLSWLAASGMALMRPSAAAWAEILWYLTAVLALTPPIAVLGGRRPIVRVWTWFVVVPLVLVFSWPVLATWQEGGAVPFTLEEPLLAGYVLVVIMGAGNYIGLGHSLPAVLWIAGLLCLVFPFCPSTADWVFSRGTGRTAAILCLAACAWTADRQCARRRRLADPSRPPIDRVWHDFRDLFGIVWARRLQERFNDGARRSGLAIRLGIHGLEPAGGNDPAPSRDAQSLAAAESSLRWLLQKFVDREWIDRRMADGNGSTCPRAPEGGNESD